MALCISHCLSASTVLTITINEPFTTRQVKIQCNFEPAFDTDQNKKNGAANDSLRRLLLKKVSART
jgi:hypothetical protein